MPRYRISTRRRRTPARPPRIAPANPLYQLRAVAARLSLLCAVWSAGLVAGPGCGRLVDDLTEFGEIADPGLKDAPGRTPPSARGDDVARPLNNAPVAVAGDDQTVVRGQPVELDATASSDPDGDRLTFRWTQVGGPPVLLGDATQAKVVFAAPYTPGTIVFGLTVQDPFGLPAVDFVTITVTEPTQNADVNDPN